MATALGGNIVRAEAKRRGADLCAFNAFVLADGTWAVSGYLYTLERRWFRKVPMRHYVIVGAPDNGLKAERASPAMGIVLANRGNRCGAF